MCSPPATMKACGNRARIRWTRLRVKGHSSENIMDTPIISASGAMRNDFLIGEPMARAGGQPLDGRITIERLAQAIHHGDRVARLSQAGGDVGNAQRRRGILADRLRSGDGSRSDEHHVHARASVETPPDAIGWHYSQPSFFLAEKGFNYRKPKFPPRLQKRAVHIQSRKEMQAQFAVLVSRSGAVPET